MNPPRRPCGIALAAALVFAAAGTGCRRPPRPNVVWITLSGLRADRLSAYGYERDTDPYFASVAAPSGRLYSACRGSPDGPLPAVAQLVSGRTLGSLVREGHPVRDARQARLLRSAFTFAELLRVRGYRCAAFSHAPWTGPADRGFAQGFDVFSLNRPGVEFSIPHMQEWRKGAVFYDALAWIREQEAAGSDAGPWFVWVYSVFTQPPFDLPPRYLGRWDPEGHLKEADLRVLRRYHLRDGHVFTEQEAEAVGALYDAAVSYTDDWLALFLDGIGELRAERPMILVISGDAPALLPVAGCPLVPCGAAASDDRVPLLVSPPGGAWAGERDDDPASLAGVAPTLLHLMGMRRPGRMDGGILLPASKGD